MNAALTVAELAYMAGIIDGEGSICVFPATVDGRPRSRYCLRLSISNTSRPLLEWVQQRFGGRLVQVKRNRETALTHKITYHWEAGWQHGASIIEAIRPFLVIKGEQGDLFLEFARGSRRFGVGGVPIELQMRRAEISARVILLNRRGPPDAVEIERRA